METGSEDHPEWAKSTNKKNVCMRGKSIAGIEVLFLKVVSSAKNVEKLKFSPNMYIFFSKNVIFFEVNVQNQ